MRKLIEKLEEGNDYARMLMNTFVKSAKSSVLDFGGSNMSGNGSTVDLDVDGVLYMVRFFVGSVGNTGKFTVSLSLVVPEPVNGLNGHSYGWNERGEGRIPDVYVKNAFKKAFDVSARKIDVGKKYSERPLKLSRGGYEYSSSFYIDDNDETGSVLDMFAKLMGSEFSSLVGKQ